MLLQLRNLHGDAPRLHRAIEELLQDHPVTSKVRLALELSSEEHFTNICNYGAPDGQPVFVEVELSWKEDGIELVFSDDGVPFNPLEHPKPDLSAPIESRPIGGLGIHMIRESMDEVQYSRQGGKNVLRMLKRVRETGCS